MDKIYVSNLLIYLIILIIINLRNYHNNIYTIFLRLIPLSYKLENYYLFIIL